MVRWSVIPVLGATALWFASVGGCAGDDMTAADAGAEAGGSGGGSAVTFSAIYPMLFPSETAPRCNFCHSMPASDTSNGNLRMGSDMAAAYAALVGKASTSSQCKGKALVVPRQPEMSLLLQKVSANPPCGSRMPIGGTPLSAAQIGMIRSWIAAGALED
jgi:hypothetical protein